MQIPWVVNVLAACGETVTDWWMWYIQDSIVHTYIAIRCCCCFFCCFFCFLFYKYVKYAMPASGLSFRCVVEVVVVMHTLVVNVRPNCLRIENERSVVCDDANLPGDLPNNTFANINVQVIYFKNCHRGTVGKDDLTQFVNARHFHIENSTIKIHEDCLENFVKLTIFRAESSLDNYLPEIMFDKLSLRRILLKRNGISSLSVNSFRSQSKLLILDLSENRIFEFPPGIFYSPSNTLRELNISYNSLAIVEPNVFVFDKPNAVLDLSHNNISRIKNGSFTNCKSLSVLNLSHNKLRTINHKVFEGITSLIILDLSYNKIIYVDWNVLSSFVQMRNMLLQHNSIVTFGPEMPRTIKKLNMTVNLKENRFRCECGRIKEAYVESIRLELHLNLTCSFGESWHTLLHLNCPVANLYPITKNNKMEKYNESESINSVSFTSHPIGDVNNEHSSEISFLMSDSTSESNEHFSNGSQNYSEDENKTETSASPRNEYEFNGHATIIVLILIVIMIFVVVAFSIFRL